MVQSSCKVYEDKVADIDFNRAETLGDFDDRSFSISFDLTGVAMRFPPRYYVVGYDNVVAVLFERSHQRDDAGRFSLQVREHSATKTERIGIVQRACWEKAKAFLTDHTKVRISEPPPAPG